MTTPRPTRLTNGRTTVSTPSTEVARPAPTPAPKPRVAVGRPQGDLEETFRLAQALAQSNLLPSALKGKPSDVLVSVLYGQELGIAPMQAIQSIYVVQGRPTISAQLWVALARRAGHKVRVIEETSATCTVEVERGDDPGHPTRVTYTLDQAKQAGLASKDVWKSHPAAMLYARAVSTACRRACPEIALGFGDEVERYEVEPTRPTLGQVAAERTDQPPAAPAAEPVQEDDQAAVLAEVQAIQAEHTGEQPVDAEFADEQDTLWPPVAQPGGAR